MNYQSSLAPDLNGLSGFKQWNTHQDVVFLSKSFYTALSKAGGLMLLGNYGALREIFSIRDLAEFVTMNRYIDLVSDQKLTAHPWAHGLWLDEGTKGELSPEQVKEIQSSVLAMATDIAFTQATLRFLTENPDEASDSCESDVIVPQDPLEHKPEETVRYKVVVLRNTVYIVVEEGFLYSIRESDAVGARARLAFLSDVLKGLYVVRSIEQANRHGLYYQYVKALVSKAKR